MAKTIRRFGERGRITLTAREDGRVDVQIWGHDALHACEGDELTFPRVEPDGEHYVYGKLVMPEDLAEAIAEANKAADAALALDAQAQGVVAAIPEAQ